MCIRDEGSAHGSGCPFNCDDTTCTTLRDRDTNDANSSRGVNGIGTIFNRPDNSNKKFGSEVRQLTRSPLILLRTQSTVPLLPKPEANYGVATVANS